MKFHGGFSKSYYNSTGYDPVDYLLNTDTLLNLIMRIVINITKSPRYCQCLFELNGMVDESNPGESQING
jgi:hypothetical protein